MDVVVIKKNNKIEVYVNEKLVKFNNNFCFVYGNIYNLDDIDNSLKKLRIEDKILNLYSKYSDNLFSKLNGEYFIILIYNNNIILVRDRLGTKHLYYSQLDEDTFICSNSLKYFVNNYKDKLEIDKQILSNYLCYSYINEPYTIFKNIYKIKSGFYLIFNNSIRNNCYYNLIDDYKKNYNKLNKLEDAEKEIESELKKSIGLRIKDKKKIGVFFSAGIDSTLVASIAKEFSNKEINTYTIGFYEEERNEADKAKEIAKYLGTIHHEYYLDHDIAKSIVKELPIIYTEPFADPSIIPMLYLNKMVDNDIDVILTGDGADQLFCGSNVYDNFDFFKKFKCFIKDIVKMIIYRSRIKKKKSIYISKKYATGMFIDIDPISYYNLPKLMFKEQIKYMLYDIKTFLSNRLFSKISFPANYYNLNITHPFIDNNCIKSTFKVNHKFKYYKKQKKFILKKILYKKIPSNMFNKSKKGFGIPLKKWLYDIYCEDIIRLSDSDFLIKQNLFNVDKINKEIDKLKNHKLNNEECYVLFSYYVFQLWYEEYMK